ncbi:hypothetical protein IMZ48_24520 [Candidatus Bathyarchaeota archaeon]|nr:hypothetical protein [Candidatus Bathyarchaeota archaeon]
MLEKNAERLVGGEQTGYRKQRKAAKKESRQKAEGALQTGGKETGGEEDRRIGPLILESLEPEHNI